MELLVIGRPREGGRVARYDREARTRVGVFGARAEWTTTSWRGSMQRRRWRSSLPFTRGSRLPAIEAMACGVPLVATTGGALPEVVGSDGETGLLVTPDDPGALASAIARHSRRSGARRPARAGEGASVFSVASHGTRQRKVRPSSTGSRSRSTSVTLAGPQRLRPRSTGVVARRRTASPTGGPEVP